MGKESNCFEILNGEGGGLPHQLRKGRRLGETKGAATLNVPGRQGRA